MNETSLIFTGDIGFDKYMDKRWEDENLLSGEVRSFLTSGDHLIVNVEGPLYEKKDTAAATGVLSLIHSMDPKVGDFLKEIGADIWNICNNHIMDAGSEGILSTLEIASKQGALTLGAGKNEEEARKPLILNEAGGIGLMGVGYQRACRKAGPDTPGCFSWSDLDVIEKEIKEIKKTCRWCIIVAHAGEEFTALPSPYTRKRYMDYLEMGADIVVAHHPHVPMNYETFEDKAIFYSLGNFIFDTDYQRSQFNTESGLFLKLRLNEDSFSFEPFGIKIDRENERILKDEIPQIFTDVQEEEYEKLIPLSSKMFIENTKRQLRFLKPEQFANASEEDWYNNFYEPLRSGRVPGECLDLQIIYPLSLKAEEGKWKTSSLENVKKFILDQIKE
ncbi:MAG: CapA family protein [Lachnospiraceae bacterium]|nr:CapA family protein [Lachnospiraceae bacterium]